MFSERGMEWMNERNGISNENRRESNKHVEKKTRESFAHSVEWTILICWFDHCIANNFFCVPTTQFYYFIDKQRKREKTNKRVNSIFICDIHKWNVLGKQTGRESAADKI